MSQSDELAFLAKIRETPDDDTPRLIFADWLDEHRQHERAELIRVSCELEPIRNQLGTPRFETLRLRENELSDSAKRALTPLLREMLGQRSYDVDLEFRRGCPEVVDISVQWFLRHGDTLLQSFPTIRRADLFRVNGWGERLAQCPLLASLEELELACWVDEEDIVALLQSPHLKSLKLLRVWAGASEQSLRNAMEIGWRDKSLPQLEDLQVVWGNDSDWTHWPHPCRIHTIDPWARPFRFAPGGGGYFDDFFPGWLPDGTQMIGMMPEWDLKQFTSAIFHRDGRQLTTQAIELPEHLIPNRGNAGIELIREVTAWLKTSIGYMPGLIAIRDTSFFSKNGVYIDNCPRSMEGDFGTLDELAESDNPDDESDRGIGRWTHHWITNECFTFTVGNDWWVDGLRGDVTST